MPYFRERLPRLKDGRRFPHYLPVDLQESHRLGRRVPALADRHSVPERSVDDRARAQRRRRRPTQ